MTSTATTPRLNNYYPIDLAKVVMAILVVAGHTGIATTYYPPLLDYLLDTRMLPFFTFSGFFFAPSFRLRRSLAHLIPMLLLYFPLLFPLDISANRDLTLLQHLHRLLFCGYNVTWFVVALIWCMIITATARRLIHNTPTFLTTIIIIGAAFYALALTQSGYHDLLADTWLNIIATDTDHITFSLIWTFPRGLICFAIGAAIRTLNITITPAKAIPLLILALAIYYAEHFIDTLLLIPDYAITITRPIATTAILLTILAYCHPTPHWQAGATARQISTMLYFTHPAIRFILYRYCHITHPITLFLLTLTIFTLIFIIYRALLRRAPRLRPILRYAA